MLGLGLGLGLPRLFGGLGLIGTVGAAIGVGLESILSNAREYKKKAVYWAYHGTSFKCAIYILFEGFNRSEDGMLGEGVYVSTDKSKA
jgi:hypothetical protein